MTKKPVISIVMGSDSDLPSMKETAEVLNKFGLSYELKILSAHRCLR
jgi:5-(carboxyamino)imidazole ribonucleotide mutase